MGKPIKCRDEDGWTADVDSEGRWRWTHNRWGKYLGDDYKEWWGPENTDETHVWTYVTRYMELFHAQQEPDRSAAD